MPNWKQIIVGDAFALDSRDKNFFRDIFLFVPFLLFTIMAISGVLSPKHGYLDVAKAGFLAILAIALVRERLPLVGASLGFVFLQSSASFVLKHDRIALAVSLVSGVSCFLLFRSLKNYKPSYSFEKGVTIATLLVMMAGGACWYAIVRLLFVKS